MRLPANRFAPLLALALLGAAPPPAVDRFGPAGDYPVTVGDPITIDGVTYTPVDTLNYDAVGYAVTAGGAGVAAGHHTLPYPSYVEVTALDSGKTTLVRIDRRGPMTGDALIELTPMARAQLGLAEGSRAAVRVRRVNPPENERALLRTGQEVPPRMDTPPGLLAALKRKLGIVPVAPLAAAPSAPVLPPPPQVSTPKNPVATVKPALPRPVVRPRPATTAKPAVSEAAVQPVTQPAPASTAEPRKPAQKSSEQTTVKSARFVQVGAFSTRDRAEAAARQVGGSVSAAGKLWRVRIAASSTTDAQAALAKAKRAGYADARVLIDR
ncbi:SPOR domain-containing protein [Novosphingobium olei]|uniref:Sporulation protein n=1 Tax=Novosphingobium olei TaxID=2728851 RepID=A0A7Y0GCG6_9SPHN|nr:SPOR domain-containing protein [Novosphingobium olei]NML95587.1 sporulation protein [Novosphingobium olei]